MNPIGSHPRTPSATSGRETAGVSEFPPPPVPPPSPPRSSGGLGGIDWNHVAVVGADLAQRWYQPLLQRESWMAVLYLFIGMLSGIGFFVAMIAVGSVVFALLFVGVGVLLVGSAFRMVDRFARVEREMAEWVGVEIEARQMRPITGIGLRAIAEPERWRQVGFLAVNLLLSIMLASVGLSAFWLVPQLVFNDPIPGSFWLIGLNLGLWVLAVVFAAVVLGAAPRIAVFVARFKAEVTAWFLGPDQLAAAERRVSDLSIQRQDILDAVASERRRIERNLHDGVQQQLVAIGLDLGMAGNQIDRDPERAKELVESARQKVQGSIGELRQLGRGLHPAILEDRGVDAALSAVVSGSPIPISVHVDGDLGLTTDTAETVYFVANEAIANVLKHAGARVASVHVTSVGPNVRIIVHDDGVGGVDPSKGTGVAGIRARVHAVDGTLAVTSPAGGPTTLIAEIPKRG